MSDCHITQARTLQRTTQHRLTLITYFIKKNIDLIMFFKLLYFMLVYFFEEALRLTFCVPQHTFLRYKSNLHFLFCVLSESGLIPLNRVRRKMLCNYIWE